MITWNDSVSDSALYSCSLSHPKTEPVYEGSCLEKKRFRFQVFYKLHNEFQREIEFRFKL